MFELLILLAVLGGAVLTIKLIAFTLHLVFLPFKILGGLLLVLIALPVLLVTAPFLLVGGAIAGIACLACFSFLF